jgi:hypothetical protein
VCTASTRLLILTGTVSEAMIHENGLLARALTEPRGVLRNTLTNIPTLYPTLNCVSNILVVVVTL